MRELSGKIGKMGVLLVMITLLAAIPFFIFTGDYEFSFLAVLLPAGALLIYIFLRDPYLGFRLFILISVFAFYPSRILGRDLPVNTGMEVLLLFLLIGTLFHTRNSGMGDFIKTPISITFFIFFLFLCLEAFNPEMQSIDGWLLFMRRFIMLLFYYLIGYKLIDSFDKLKSYFRYWILIVFIVCLYGYYQQFFGLFDFELRELMRNQKDYELAMQGGLLRKSSFLADMITYGVICGSMSVFTLILALHTKEKQRRRLYFFLCAFFWIGMNFSGTRTLVIMLPAAVALYSLMTIGNRRTLLVIFSTILLFLFIMFVPIYTNPVLNRMRSTFEKDNASKNVRDWNRRYIQPYILKHPIGGGIFTTGDPGKRFNPNHPLAGFPPDSGFLQSALEVGWVGYGLYILFYIAVLYQGISYYFAMRNKEMKKYVLAIVVMSFSALLVQYSQASEGQLPNTILTFSAYALITRLKEFDKESRQKNNDMQAIA